MIGSNSPIFWLPSMVKRSLSISISNNFGDNMWKGTKNVDPGVFPPFGNEDYSSASFYRVNIHPTDGDNQIVVKTGGPKSIDNDNNVVR